MDTDFNDRLLILCLKSQCFFNQFFFGQYVEYVAFDKFIPSRRLKQRFLEIHIYADGTVLLAVNVSIRIRIQIQMLKWV